LPLSPTLRRAGGIPNKATLGYQHFSLRIFHLFIICFFICQPFQFSTNPDSLCGFIKYRQLFLGRDSNARFLKETPKVYQNPGGFAYYLILSKKILILFHTVSLSLLFLFFMEEI